MTSCCSGGLASLLLLLESLLVLLFFGLRCCGLKPGPLGRMRVKITHVVRKGHLMCLDKHLALFLFDFAGFFCLVVKPLEPRGLLLAPTAPWAGGAQLAAWAGKALASGGAGGGRTASLSAPARRASCASARDCWPRARQSSRVRAQCSRALVTGVLSAPGSSSLSGTAATSYPAASSLARNRLTSSRVLVALALSTSSARRTDSGTGSISGGGGTCASACSCEWPRGVKWYTSYL